MKNLKLSFALIVAVMAVGVTFASKASQIGSKLVTACFQNVVLQNAAGTASYTPAQTDLAATANTAIFTNQIKYLDAQPSVIRTDCEETQRFCCVILDEAAGALPNVTPFTIDGVNAKWEVVEIQFHD